MTTLERPTTEATPPRRAAGAGGPALFRPHVLGAIFRRDFLGYFSNPAGYVFITLFVLASSWVAFGLPQFFANNLANLNTLNEWMPYLLLFFVPAITMSVWAEERRQGTEELLLTLPARDVEVVLGKYLAAVGIYTVALAFSLSHVVVLSFLGKPDPGVMFATYIGYWLMGSMMIAFGLVASVLSSNVTVAFILGALFCAIPVFADLLGSFLVALPRIGEPIGRMLEALSVPEQFRDFGAGVIPLSGVFYFAALAAVMLYVNMVLLGRRHWAGGQKSSGLGLHYLARTVALIVALASLVTIVAYSNVRLDASTERINVLSADSRKLIAEIPADKPVFIHAYYSPEVPREYVQVKLDLLAKLREIAALGGPKIRLNLVETERFTEAAREAETQFGITPRSVFTEDEARQSVDDIFLGVAFASGAEEVVVPFLDRGLPVEYELIRSIRVVSGTGRKKVGILQTDARLLGGFDMSTMNQGSEWEIVTELKKQYEVSSVSPDGPIPTDLDALLVAQPSSLTQPQVDNLTAYVKAGGPALLFVDPLPQVDPSMAPMEPKTPPGGPFGGGPQPEPKGDLTALFDLLGVAWPADQIVWNPYNPHPFLAEVPEEYLFVGEGSEARGGAFGDDPASSGLQEVVLLFAGLLRQQSAPGAKAPLEFTPLLRTNDLGGTLSYSETVQRSFMGMPGINRVRPHFPSGSGYTLAARVKGELPDVPEADATKQGADIAKKTDASAPRSVHVVLVSDLDMISDGFFEFRRKPRVEADRFDFDNVTFILNCVDTLAGDDSFVALRKRRPEHRTLLAVESQARRFYEASQKAAKEADDEAKAELAEAQAALDKKVEEVSKREDLDPRTKDIMLDQMQQVENRRFEVTKATIDAQKEREKEEAVAQRERGIRAIHGRIKALAILLPPLPALILATVVFFVRSGRENRGANANRLA